MPIIIGMFEAQAIAIEIEKISPNRPMTHDLFKSFSAELGFHVQEIVISDLKEGVFYSSIVCNDAAGNQFEVDSRPSDAIAIGLRFEVPIYTFENIMSEAGIVLSEFDEEEEDDTSSVSGVSQSETKEATGGKENLSDYSIDKLNSLLEAALSQEDYEQAAKIRDELNRRN